MEKPTILLDAGALKYAADNFPALVEQVADLKRLLGIYKESYTERMLCVKEFEQAVGITRTTFESWKAAQLFRYVQTGKRGVLNIPHTEVVRINELCKDIPHKQRYQYLLTLKNQTVL